MSHLLPGPGPSVDAIPDGARAAARVLLLDAEQRLLCLQEIEQATAEFAPRQLARLLPAILRREYPDPPLDCGV